MVAGAVATAMEGRPEEEPSIPMIVAMSVESEATTPMTALDVVVAEEAVGEAIVAQGLQPYMLVCCCGNLSEINQKWVKSIDITGNVSHSLKLKAV